MMFRLLCLDRLLNSHGTDVESDNTSLNTSPPQVNLAALRTEPGSTVQSAAHLSWKAQDTFLDIQKPKYLVAHLIVRIC
jgi:hypothetical protein